MIVTGDDGWLFYRGLENSLRVLTELLLTIPYWLKRIRKKVCSPEMMTTQLEPNEPVTFAKLPINLEKTNRSPAVVINFPSATVEIMDGAAPETIQAVLLAMKVLC